MSFHVGQKVECIDAEPRDERWVPLVKGAVYSVCRLTYQGQGLLLNEVRSPWNMFGDFWADRFRPITENKTDISIFTALLNPSERERKLNPLVTEDA